MSYIIETIRGAWMLLGFTAGGSLVGLLLTMSVFRDIIESIFIDGLTEKEYLDYLRRTERRKYSASKMVRIYKERPRKFSSSIMTYRIVSFVFLAIHLILTAVIIICTFLPIHFGARQAFGLMAANLIIGGILETLYKRLSSQTAAGDKRYSPEKLFSDTDILDRIRSHPMTETMLVYATTIVRLKSEDNDSVLDAATTISPSASV